MVSEVSETSSETETRVCYSHDESLQAARSSVTDEKYGTELERVRRAAPLVFSRHRKRHKIQQNKDWNNALTCQKRGKRSV